ncbi:MAG: carbohydrate binding family 9 domain-containing protein, partial [Longimicrobiales bacterium]
MAWLVLFAHGSAQPGADQQADSQVVVRAARAATAPRIDGRLDESIWQTALPVSTFRQVEPDTGQPASERTEVRVLFNDGALYVG